MRIVGRDAILEAGSDLQVVDVLPQEEYEWAHLPDALHVPLRQFDELAPERLDPARPTVAYCNDLQCDMSPRAARRMDQLGFADVMDYAAGKMDWLAHGLPYEGAADLIGRHLRTLPSCAPDEVVADVADRMGDAPLCVVMSPERIVLGVVAIEDLTDRSRAPVRELASFGTATVRPSEERSELEHRMRHADLGSILVTDSGGHLIGLYERSDAR